MQGRLLDRYLPLHLITERDLGDLHANCFHAGRFIEPVAGAECLFWDQGTGTSSSKDISGKQEFCPVIHMPEATLHAAAYSWNPVLCL